MAGNFTSLHPWALRCCTLVVDERRLYGLTKSASIRSPTRKRTPNFRSCQTSTAALQKFEFGSVKRPMAPTNSWTLLPMLVERVENAALRRSSPERTFFGSTGGPGESIRMTFPADD